MTASGLPLRTAISTSRPTRQSGTLFLVIQVSMVVYGQPV